MKKSLFVILIFSVVFSVQAQDKAMYKIYAKDGKASDYASLIKKAVKADIILFGELHDNPVIHWLELQLLKDMHAAHEDIIIGMEMFEADDQIVLNEYLNGTIEERHLTAEAKMWNNYKTDYKPIIEFAKSNGLPVIATNIPRRYANLVYRKGIASLETIDEQSKNWIAPLPVEIDLDLPGYKSMISSMGGHGTPESAENLARSQAMKDATMAYFTAKHWQKKSKFIHYHGTYHSKDFEGINWYLQREKETRKADVLIIHSVEQKDIHQLDEAHKGSADFILVITADMIKTY
jgi:uncharacterized iron-regulated protein